MKTAYTTAAVAALMATVAIAGNAETHTKADANVKAEAGIGTAVTKTGSAAYEKSAQGVNAVKGSYHQNMADSNAEAAKENLAKGDLNDAATDAKDAAEHQAMAADAKGKAAVNKDKASKDWATAKAAVSTSGSTK